MDPVARAAAHRRALLLLAAGNAAAAVVHAIGYERAVAAGAGGRAYLALALAGQLAAAFLVPAALLLPLARAAAGRAALHALAPAVATAVQLALYVDRKLFAAMGFHVNGLALDVVLQPGGLGALEIPAGEGWMLAAAWTAALLAEAALYALAVSRAARAGEAGSGRGRGWVRASFVVVLLLAADRVTYAAATLSGHELGAAVAAAPGYGIERRFRLRAAAAEEVRYPRAPLELGPPGRRPNVVWVVIESWRRDGLDPDVTPALWRWSQRSLVFRNHVAGGNSTVYGVFTQFYGLNGNYVEPLSRARRGPVLFQALRALGYRTRVVASPPLEYASIRDAVFADVDEVLDALPGHDPCETDRAAVDDATAFLAKATPGQPFALILFLDGTHLPYHFDPRDARFRPYAERIWFTDLPERGDRELVRNRYRNALAAVDGQLGRVFDALERRGLADDTITVVVGDHGDQLYEHGRLGHALSLSPEETTTPLLLRVPGVAPAQRTDLSRHVDLPATVLTELGVRSPPSQYSSGRSLLRDPEPDFALLAGWMFRGVRSRDGWTVEWDAGDHALHDRAEYRVLDAEYRPARSAPERSGAGIMVRALEEWRAFSR